MPKSKTKSHKKSRKSTKKAPKNNALVTRGLVNLGKGFPKMVKVTQTYIDTINLTSTSGVPATYRFSANGLYDPNITSTGHQPIFYDQLAALYDHYVVLGSKIEATWVNQTSTTPPTVYSFIINDDTTVVSSDPATLGEQTGAKKKVVGYGNSDAHRMTLNYSARKIHGRGVLANNSLQGNVNSMPSDQTYYDFHFRALDGVSTAAVSIEFKITYIVVWKELSDITAS